MMTRKFRNKPSSNSIKHIRKSKKSLKNKRTNKIIGGADQLVEAIIKDETPKAKELLNKTSIIRGIKSIVKNPFNEPLKLAIIKGNLDIVKLLIEKGANINVKYDLYNTPLHIAMINGNLEIVKLLIEKGADVNAKNETNDTPLHIAMIKGNHDIVKLLIEKGADINIENTKLIKPLDSVKDGEILNLFNKDLINDEKYKVICNNILLYSIIRNKLKDVNSLIQSGIDVNITDKDGNKPLHIVLKNKEISDNNTRMQIVSSLIEKADIKAIDKYGNTPLHLVIQNNPISKDIRKKIIVLLIQKGADINIQNVEGKTPLYIASSKNEVDIGNLLIEKGANVNTPDKKGVTPLHVAQTGPMVTLLIQNKADVNAVDAKGKTPLHWNAEFVKEKSDLIIFDIFKSEEANFDAEDNEGNTPLHIAVYNKYNSVWNYLVKNGANMNKKSEKKSNPLSKLLFSKPTPLETLNKFNRV